MSGQMVAVGFTLCYHNWHKVPMPCSVSVVWLCVVQHNIRTGAVLTCGLELGMVVALAAAG